MLDRPAVLLGWLLIVGVWAFDVGCGGNVARPSASMDAGGTSVADAAPQDGGRAADATPLPSGSCTSNADCPTGMSCLYAIGNSCPSLGSCFEGTVSSDCDSLMCICGCNGNAVNVSDCPTPGGYWYEPTGADASCDSAGCD